MEKLFTWKNYLHGNNIYILTIVFTHNIIRYNIERPYG
jgi:hypothetical protein